MGVESRTRLAQICKSWAEKHVKNRIMMDNLGKTSLASKTLTLQLSLLVFPMFALKFWYFFKH